MKTLLFRSHTISAIASALVALFTIIPQLYADTTTGLTGHWTFDDGTANDKSGNNYHGVLRNGAAVCLGSVPFTNTLCLDGIDDYVTLPTTALNSLPQGTIAGFVYVTEYRANGVPIISKGDDVCTEIALGVQHDGLLNGGNIACDGKTLASVQQVPTNQWTHVAFSWDGTWWKLYIDGFQDTQTPSTLVVRNTSRELKLGRHYPTYAFAGQLDDLRVYNRALSASDVFELSQQGFAPRITTQPVDKSAFAGQTAVFQVSALGKTPVFYQWRHNGTDILGAGDALLVLTGVRLWHQGSYSVLVSNAYGSVTSESVMLTVSMDDIDEDGISDSWEIENGLNPLVNDANEDRDLDGLTNLEEYHLWLSQPEGSRWQRADLADSLGDGLSDYERLHGVQTNRFHYDKLDRLIGAEYNHGSNGLSIAYVYDGNGNILRQKHLQRDANGNGLPDLWEFLNNLTNNTSAYVDTDGDGWTDWQEWKAGSNAGDAASIPDVLGVAGTNLVSMAWPFTPSNFVMAVGQLDGTGPEEIVIGADGDPGTTTNFFLLLSQTTGGWTTQKVNVGSIGITSLAIGQTTNRTDAAVYFGTRSALTNGQVIEASSSGTDWSLNVVAVSTNSTAYVLGLIDGSRLAAVFSPNGMVENALYAIHATNSASSNLWFASLQTTNRSSLETLGSAFVYGSKSIATVRLLADTNAISVQGAMPAIPSWATNRPGSSSWYFQTPTLSTWSNAQAYAETFGGNLVTIEDASENLWISTNFTQSWIGLFCPPSSDALVPGNYVWVSGSSASFRNFAAGEPNNASTEKITRIRGSGNAFWDNYNAVNADHKGLVEVTNYTIISFAIANAWGGTTRTWRGSPFASGKLRNGAAAATELLYGFVEDKNTNGTVDADDEFTLFEYAVGATNYSTITTNRISLISQSELALSYGLACVNFLSATNDVLFTGEPDGRIFAWTATNSTGPLKRQLFSAALGGKAWHHMEGHKGLVAGEALAGLWVDPTNPATCNLAYFAPAAGLPVLAEFPQNAPIAAILPIPNSGQGIAPVDIRLWDAEGNLSLPQLQVSTNSGTSWFDAIIASLDGGALGYVTAAPTGTTHQLLWNAAANLGAPYTNTVRLRLRAHDNALIGDWSATNSYALQISPGNPIAFNDAVTTLEDVPLNIAVLANDSVTNGQTLSISNLTQPAHGLAVMLGGTTVLYTPATNYSGADSFSYTATDGAGGTSVASVSITVIPVNDPPTAQLYTFATTEDFPLSLRWNPARDAEGDTVTLLSAGPTSANGGTVSVSDGVLTYTPAPNFNGSDSFNYTLIDDGKTAGTNDFKTGVGTVTVNVIPVNDAPIVLVPGPQVIDEDTTLVFGLTNAISVVDVDAGTNAMWFSLSAAHGRLTLSTTNGLSFLSGTNGAKALAFNATLAAANLAFSNLTYLPDAEFGGVDLLNHMADDQGHSGSGGALTDAKAVTISVTPVNDLPLVHIFQPTNHASFIAPATVTIEASASDVDGEIVKVEFFAGTNKLGERTNLPYLLVWSNVAAGSYTLTAVATDNLGATNVSPEVFIASKEPGFVQLDSPQLLPGDTFTMLILGEIGQVYTIEASTNLITWETVGTVTNQTGTAQFQETVPGGAEKRYYRALLLQ